MFCRQMSFFWKTQNGMKSTNWHPGFKSAAELLGAAAATGGADAGAKEAGLTAGENYFMVIIKYHIWRFP